MTEVKQLNLPFGPEFEPKGKTNKSQISVDVIRPDFSTKQYKLVQGSSGYQDSTNWVIEGLIPSSGLSCIGGLPASFKSFLSLSMAYSVSTGNPWYGHTVERGTVLYIAAEGDLGVAKRIRALEMEHGLEAEDLYILPESVFVSNQVIQSEITKVVEKLNIERSCKVNLIVIDTLARCYLGSENDSSEMQQFVAGCDYIVKNTGASVLCIHHSGKDPSKGLRGSSALLGALDCCYLVKKTGQDSCSFENIKMKDAEEPSPVRCLLKQVELGLCRKGRKLSSLVITAIEGGSPVLKNCVIISALQSSKTGMVKRDELRELFIRTEAIDERDLSSEELKKRSATLRKRFSRYLDKLVAQRVIEVSSDTISLVD